MNQTEKNDRFDELRAGRAMGDLSHEEMAELEKLAAGTDLHDDLEFDLLAAAIEVEALRDSAEPLPASLRARLEKHADAMANPAAEKIIRPPVSAWRKLVGSPLTGWAAAAAVAFGFFLAKEKEPLPPAMAEAKLRSAAPDLIERKFAGLGTFKDAGGKVIWSDELQQGYMTLTGIPANDPKKAQYQLWIVDPKRDEAPVDGGVFDIPADGSPVVVPISAKLALTNPQAFVITLEQPGGVVKSKQEKVVALAKL